MRLFLIAALTLGIASNSYRAW